MPATLGLSIAAFVLGVACLFFAGPTSAQSLVFYASSAGKPTYDSVDSGGNPFASALIELLGRSSVELAVVPSELKALTFAKSGSMQTPEVPIVQSERWMLVPRTDGEKRLALVLIVSRYTGGAQSLPGAATDAHRVADALRRTGFDTEVVLDHDLDAMRLKLLDFSRKSAAYDAAAIYTTGHGVQANGQIFLIPGSYPIKQRNAGLSALALPLREIAAAPRARAINLVFYGGCRDDPFSR